MRRLLQELKRRKVYRVGVTYAVVGFVVIQTASLIFPALAIPGWAYSLVVVLALLGFPVALVLAWAFEVTPEGIRRTEADDVREDAGGGTDATAWIGLGALVVLAGVGAWWLAMPGAGDSRGAEAAPEAGVHGDPIRSVAVLPFADMSPAGDQQYFGDGLADEILDALTRVSGLRVVSRTASFRFRGDRVDPRAIGDSLDADAILEGSVRRAGDQLKVTAQLIDADDALHRWSRSFERELTTDNLFDVQEEIARAIVAEMRREGGDPAGEGELVRRPATSLETYDLYLRARFHWNRRTREDLETAIGLYRRAIGRDSSFALAWSGLAESYVVPAARMSPAEALPRAEEAARRALELDSTLAPAHTALAAALMAYHWDWEAAGRRFRRAMELDPRYATAHQWYGEWLAARGRTAEGVVAARRAEELDPYSMIILWNVARNLYFDRRYDEAVAQLDELRGLYPNVSGRELFIRLSAEWMRGNEAAVRRLIVSEAPPDAGFEVRDTLRTGGIEALVRATLRAMEAREAAEGDAGAEEAPPGAAKLPAWMLIEAGRGDELLRDLERAVADRDLGWAVVDVAADPALDPLRDDPRYRELLRRVNLRP